jgi:hypothetical protein
MAKNSETVRLSGLAFRAVALTLVLRETMPCRIFPRHPEVPAVARLEGWAANSIVILQGAPKRARAAG